MDHVHAPYSPIASTSRVPYCPDSPFVPSSDFGEQEEAIARRSGEAYWAHPASERSEEGHGKGVQEVAEQAWAGDKLAISPARRAAANEDLPSPSMLFRKIPRRRRHSGSPASAQSLTPSSHTSPRSPRISSHTSPPPPRPAFEAETCSLSPARSDQSSELVDLIARSSAAVGLRMPSSSSKGSPSPPRRCSRRPSQHGSSPAHSPPPPAPDPLPAGRSFRTRTVAQLKPYSTEQFRYTKTLLRNGWEGAVVAGPRRVEESAEELRRKKLQQEQTRKDDLGGWLVLAEGQEGKAGDSEGDGISGDDGEEEDSADGLSLLEREARRKERMTREVDAALHGKGKVKARDRDGRASRSPRPKGPSRIDDPNFRPDVPRFTAKRPRQRFSASLRDDVSSGDERPTRRLRAESEPPSSSPQHPPLAKRPRPRTNGLSKRKEYSSDGDHRPRKPLKSAARADSEPPSSSPARPSSSSSRRIRRKMAQPSKLMHARGIAGEARSALDADILNLPTPRRTSASDSDDSAASSWDSESEAPSDEEDGAEEEEESLDPSSRLKLGGKRKRALGMMMPAVFLKKAQADLKLMEKEREMGFSSGSELNSGDEEAQEQRRRNRAKIRNVPRMLDEPLRLDGDAYTDESGEELVSAEDSAAEEDAQQENDAVTSWLQSFAPRRGGGSNEDIIDRFLKRAKRPTAKGPGHTKRKEVVKGGKVMAKGKENGAKSADAGRRRAGGRSIEPDQQRRAPYKTPHRPVKAISLDTEQAIYVFAGLRDEGDRPEDDEIVILSPRPRPQPLHDAARPPSRAHRASTPVALPEHTEIWAKFGKFSHDFDIQCLPVGVQFTTPNSLVKNGHLFSLVNPPTSTSINPPFSCEVVGLSLRSSMSSGSVEAALPTLVDAIFDTISAFLASAEAADPITDASRPLRFIGTYISTQLVKLAPDEKHRFGSALAMQLDHLDVRLDSLSGRGASLERLRRCRILLSWYAIDITARLGSVNAVGGDSKRLARLATLLVRRLIQYGADRTLCSLKAVMKESPPDGLVVSDITVEAWLGLISLALKPDGFGDTTFDQDDLWSITIDETLAALPTNANKAGPIAGEVVSLTTMMLCAISQFSPSGMSTSSPRLRAHWPALVCTLDAIKPSALAAPDHTTSSTAIARRDRYLWTLFARCLVLVERWKWRVDVKEELLPKLFDLLAARRLANLTTETAGDFPSFLQDLDEFGTLALDRSTDTAFSIFLKLVMSAVQNLPGGTDAEKRKRSTQLTRLSVRLAPMTTAWSRQSPELIRSESILINHYSLLLLLAILHPASASQKVEQASKLLSFSDVDEEARKTSIRAVLYFALAFRQQDLSLQPVADWLAKIVTHLRAEYVDVEKQRRIKERGLGRSDRPDKSKGDPLWHRALMLTMALRSVQVVLRWKRSGAAEQEYPNSSMLHPAWTSQLLDSPLALDPMIGREVIKTIECFLDIRRAALPRAPVPAPPAAQDEGGISQDDYGMFDDLDYEDPSLTALLGIENGTVDKDDRMASKSTELQSRDQAVAEIVKASLAPAFFRLVSNIYVDAIGSGPTVGDRASYAEHVVECWTRCLALMVEHGLDDWGQYLRYGNFSWKRIGDPVGRRDIGLFLAIQILKHDPEVYTTCTDEILEIWFASIVSRKLTAQNTLTEILLNVDNGAVVSPLFERVPFKRSEGTGRVGVEQLELLDKRVEMLQVVFENAARFVVFSASSTAPFARPAIPKTSIMNHLRNMLASMRDNLASIRDEPSRRSYSSFVKQVLSSLINVGTDGVPGKKGPFDEAGLPDIRALKTAVA
ncbi:hypothetical protein JCM1841_001376 [Sporobolomyces salmonicolor]